MLLKLLSQGNQTKRVYGFRNMGQLEGHGEVNPQSVDMNSILSPQELFLTYHLILSPTYKSFYGAEPT
jgi:hypothetical protein